MTEAVPFGSGKAYPSSLVRAARATMKDVLAARKGSRLLIITNPNDGTREIAMSLFDSALEVGAHPVLTFQVEKGQFDFAEEEVIKAMTAEPDIVLSISKDRMGLDRHGLKNGYQGRRRYDNLFDMLAYEGRIRAFWSPGITPDMFSRTVPIDYAQLRDDCRRVAKALGTAEEVRVTAPGGTDVTIGLRGRTPRKDDGDIRKPGKAGNIPAGEVYVSPELGTVDGVVAFDGSIALDDGEIVIKEPIVVRVKEGFVSSISSTPEGKLLRRSIRRGERNASRLADKGEIPKSEGEKYRLNARAIGELGIGLNRRAKIVANMLEDEKVYGTCHFAVGSNYDGDADALIHLDGLVKRPTITLLSGRTGKESPLMVKGRLVWD